MMTQKTKMISLVVGAVGLVALSMFTGWYFFADRGQEGSTDVTSEDSEKRPLTQQPIQTQDQEKEEEDTGTSTSTPTEEQEPSSSSAEPVLDRLETIGFEEGTHRPEMALYKDKLYVVTVHGAGQHQGYIFDASDTYNIDFDNPETTFTATSATEEYGSPADHRITILNDELIVVYQTLVVDESAGRPTSGPSETYAKEQYLMLARFSLDGEEIDRMMLVKSTDKNEDNFPDMTINTYGDKLLVSTGMSQGMKIRVVDPENGVEDTYEFSTLNVQSIGNSLVWGANDQLYFFSYIMNPTGDGSITTTPIYNDFTLGETIELGSFDGDVSFPTGVVYQNGYYFVAFTGREGGGAVAIETNPLSPRFRVLDASFNVVDDIEISNEAGTGHVHPVMVISGDRLWYAWSKKLSGRYFSQVQIEVFDLSYE